MSRDLTGAAFPWICCKCCLSRCVCSMCVEFGYWVCQRSIVEVLAHIIYESLDQRSWFWWGVVGEDCWMLDESLGMHWLSQFDSTVYISNSASVGVYMQNFSWISWCGFERLEIEPAALLILSWLLAMHLLQLRWVFLVRLLHVLWFWLLLEMDLLNCGCICMLYWVFTLSNPVWLDLVLTDGVILNNPSSRELS